MLLQRRVPCKGSVLVQRVCPFLCRAIQPTLVVLILPTFSLIDGGVSCKGTWSVEFKKSNGGGTQDGETLQPVADLYHRVTRVSYTSNCSSHCVTVIVQDFPKEVITCMHEAHNEVVWDLVKVFHTSSEWQSFCASSLRYEGPHVRNRDRGDCEHQCCIKVQSCMNE